MFQTSSHVDPRLTELAAAAVAEETGLRVISARVYTVPYADVHVAIEVLADRQFNILEEFILRAAHELQPRPTLEGLAAMLGLDPLFVGASWQKLAAMQAVALDQEQVLGLTDRGREYYLQGQLPPTPLEEELDLRYWFVSDVLVPAGRPPRSPAPDPMLPGCGCEDEDAQMAALAQVINDVSRVISVTVEAGLGLHQPEEGQVIHAVRSWRISATDVTPVAVLAVQETAMASDQEDSVTLRAFDPVSGLRDFATEMALQAWMGAGTVTLRDFLPEDAGLWSTAADDEADEPYAAPAQTALEADHPPHPTAQEVPFQDDSAVIERWDNLSREVLRSGGERVSEEVFRGLEGCCLAWVAAGQYVTALQQVLALVDAAPLALPAAFRLMAATLQALQRLPDDLLRDQTDIEPLREAVIDIDARIGDLPEDAYAAEQDRLDATWRTLRGRLAAS